MGQDLELKWTDLPVDPDLTLKTILDVHADQIFEHGCLNGDPHPGNILLSPDGTLGLIDFGQVKLLTLEERLLYATLIVGLAENDQFKIVQTYKQMGVRTKRNTPSILAKWARILNDRDDAALLEGYNFQEYMEILNKRDPILTAPEAFVIVQRAGVLLRGCGYALGRQLSLAKAWAPHARRLLAKHRGVVKISCLGEKAPNAIVARPTMSVASLYAVLAILA